MEKALDELRFDEFDVGDLEKELNGASSSLHAGADVFTSYQSLTINPEGCTPPLSIPGAMSEPSPQQSFTPQSPTSPRDQFSPFSTKMVSLIREVSFLGFDTLEPERERLKPRTDEPFFLDKFYLLVCTAKN